MKRKIFKTGHSLAVTISTKLLGELGLSEGDTVEVESEGKQIIISKAKNREQLDLGLKIRKKL